MKRLLVCVSLIAATTTAAISAPAPAAKPTAKPTPAQKLAPVKVAPADEYFGKLKISVLGIRNTIKDVGANIEIDQTRWLQQASKAAFAQDAVHDWERKYPSDTWLAKTLFSLERMYAKLDTDEGRKEAVATMRWLIHDFPSSWYAKTGKKELALGKVGRPLVAAQPTPSPSPDQIAAPDPVGSTVPAIGGQQSATGATAREPANDVVGASPLPSPSPSSSPALPTPLPSSTPPLLNPP